MDPMAEVANLFEGLFDDAAVFPPGNVPLPVAIADHARHGQAWYAATVGPLVVPAARIEEVAEYAQISLQLAITARLGDPGLDQHIAVATDHAQLEVRAVELVIPSSPDGKSADESVAAVAEVVAALGTSTDVFVEDPDHSTAVLDTLASEPTRMMVKLRTGGVVASAFPSETQLGRWIADCAERGLPFKCTAGLHHAVRHAESDSGFEHHGFLNVILAAGAALDGAPVADLVEVLSLRDRAAVVDQVAQFSQSALADIRERFVSFGTCSVDEPIDDLVALGLLAPPDPVSD